MLIVALILLLVLTVLGLAASRSTSLEERMAGNERNQNLAFQAAEAGLRAGEFCLTTAMPACTTYSHANSGGNGAYLFNAANTVTLWTQSGFWGTPGNALDYTTITGESIPLVAEQPQLIIESLPSVAAQGGNLACSGYGCYTPPIQRWRITSRGTGGDTSSTVMLQEIYQCCGS
ncbi:MAG: pilus assembly PilX family protein [Gammaproteobacteria bacterium]